MTGVQTCALPIYPGDAAITEAIIGLARGLGLTVIAEGVETQAQLDFLAARDCHCFQGYWLSRPLPVAEFEQFLATSPGENKKERMRLAAETLRITEGEKTAI